jgi:hypothetical protein
VVSLVAVTFAGMAWQKARLISSKESGQWLWVITLLHLRAGPYSFPLHPLQSTVSFHSKVELCASEDRKHQ